MLHDLRHGLRCLRAHPNETILAVLTLAMGVAASTTVFTLADRHLLRPLPYPESDQIAVLSFAPLVFNQTDVDVAPEVASADAFEAVGLAMPIGLNVGEGQRVERVQAAAVSRGFFGVLGARPIHGRLFGPKDSGRSKVAVIGYRLWRDVYAGDLGIFSRAARINGQLFQIVGVLPESVRYPDGAEVWIPPLSDPQLMNGATSRIVIARIKSSFVMSQASDSLLSAYTTRFGPDRAARMTRPLLTSLQERLAARHRTTLLVLSGMVVLLLIATCTSVASLLLARFQGRVDELSVRKALGASPTQLARESLAESSCIAGPAVAIGWLAASWLSEAAGSVWAAPAPDGRLSFDGRVFITAVAVAFCAWVGVSLLPLAAVSLAPDPRAVRIGSRQSHRSSRFGSLLAVVQMTVALILVAASIGGMQLVAALHHVDLGFGNKQSFVFDFVVPAHGAEAVSTVIDRIEERVRSLPAVVAVGSSDLGPGSRSGAALTPLTFSGLAITADEGLPPKAQLVSVTQGYFQAVGISCIAGRLFSEADAKSPRRTVVLSDLAVKALRSDVQTVLGRRFPLGQQFWGRMQTSASDYAEVIGVVGNTRVDGVRGDPMPQVYQSLRHSNEIGTVSLAVDIRPSNEAALAAIRRAIADVRPDVPVYNVRTIEQLQASFVADERLSVVVGAASSVLALGLSALGLFGLLSQQVMRRSREFGIRIALGEAPSRLYRSVLVFAGRLAFTGILVGTIAVFASGRWAQSRIHGLAAPSAGSIGLAAIVIVIVAIGAAAIPARRAATADPSRLLRSD